MTDIGIVFGGRENGFVFFLFRRVAAQEPQDDTVAGEQNFAQTFIVAVADRCFGADAVTGAAEELQQHAGEAVIQPD